jgi:aspartyl-tRNA(Asn)/glutamyl-tRNA(Gln) amidotransferase subunit A
VSGWRSKDLFDTAGVRTTYGSAIFAEHVPSTTAAAVARLQAAGYTSVGKANLHEFAWGITSENQHFGTVPNPVAANRLAGGSSGGCAAALAAGLAEAALGSDSGGSIRIPAACCGVTGFKPTFGLVPLAGCFPLAPSFDHAGPMARDVAGCETIMRALVPGFAAAPLGQLDDLEVAIAWTDAADPLVRDRVQRAAALFSRSRTVELPFPDGTAPAFSREAAEVQSSVIIGRLSHTGIASARTTSPRRRVSSASSINRSARTPLGSLRPASHPRTVLGLAPVAAAIIRSDRPAIPWTR